MNLTTKYVIITTNPIQANVHSFYIEYTKGKVKGEHPMISLAVNTDSNKVKSKFNDEFESYLKRQCLLKTTFNGLEIETFSWYKKVLGLV